MTNWKTRQNGDGGWAYSRGASWTEPTVFALLAQSVAMEEPAHDTSPENGCQTGVSTDGSSSIDASSGGPCAKTDRESFLRGVKFLGSIARRDGGWSPKPDVEESTWVTALAVLLPEDAITGQRRRQAIDWLKSRTGRESGWRFRLQQRLNGDKESFPDGWPWFPGAAAWVIPTSLGILAFERAIRHGDAESDELRKRVEEGRKFLLQRMCADGGWNHGTNRVLGRDGDSYPETTGIALLAMAGQSSAQIERAKATARKHLAACRTAEGIAWLRIALAAHGERPVASFDPVRRTNMDDALMILAAAARNPLLA